MIDVYKHIVVKNRSPEQIYNWVTNLTPEKFRQWSPGVHLDAKLKVSELKIGDSVCYEVLLDGAKKQLSWEIMDLQEKVKIVSKLKGLYPVCVHLSFIPAGGDTEVVYNLKVGFTFFGVERLVDCFVSSFILTGKKIEAIKLHEEVKFKNLENIIC